MDLIKMTKQLEIDEYKEKLREKPRSFIHKRSLEIAEYYMSIYPDTWKEKIRTNRELEAIKQLLKDEH